MYNNHDSVGLTSKNHGEFGNPHPQYCKTLHKTVLANVNVGQYVKIASIKLGSTGIYNGRYTILNTGSYLGAPFGELSIRIHCVTNTPTVNMCYKPLTIDYPSPFEMFCTMYDVLNGETTVDLFMKLVSNDSYTIIANMFTDLIYYNTWVSEYKTKERPNLDFFCDEQTPDTLANIKLTYSNEPIFNKIDGVVQFSGISSTSLPIASEFYRGAEVLMRKYNGTDDEKFICIKLADSTYTWKKVV